MHLRADFLSISSFIGKNAIGANILSNYPFSTKRKEKQSISEIIIEAIRRGFFLSDFNLYTDSFKKTSICVSWAIPKLICLPLWDNIKLLCPTLSAFFYLFSRCSNSANSGDCYSNAFKERLLLCQVLLDSREVVVTSQVSVLEENKIRGDGPGRKGSSIHYLFSLPLTL